MKKTGIILVFLTVSLAVACSGPSGHEPSKENFTNVLNAYLQKEGITVDFTDQMPVEIEIERLNAPATIKHGNIEIPLVKRPKSNRPTSQRIKCERLEQLGLLISRETIIEKADKGETVKYKVRQYDSTEKGRQFILAPDAAHARYRLRIATAAVDKIDQFTSPTPVKGLTVSRVTYAFSPDTIQDWAENTGLEESFPEIRKKLAKGQSDTATLVLMDDGWKHGHEVAGDILGK